MTAPIRLETTGAGYRCGICRTFVPYNTTHVCGGNATRDGGTFVAVPSPDLRIADALERIAAALEVLASPPSELSA